MKHYQRAFWSVFLKFLPGGTKKKTEFIRKHHLFGSIGNNCSIQKWKLPLHSELVYLHDNVRIASDVRFVTHDIIHKMLNQKYQTIDFIEKVGCIEIMDNVFVGSGSRILYNTKIGSNVIIGSDSLINKDVPDNSVYAGVPARFICTFDEYVEKARQYSDSVRELYGIDKMPPMNKELASKIHEIFLKERTSS